MIRRAAGMLPPRSPRLQQLRRRSGTNLHCVSVDTQSVGDVPWESRGGSSEPEGGRQG